jgi:hypothetical protein
MILWKVLEEVSMGVSCTSTSGYEPNPPLSALWPLGSLLPGALRHRSGHKRITPLDPPCQYTSLNNSQWISESPHSNSELRDLAAEPRLVQPLGC